ncbi:hypothetical protein F5878DRAFT_396216 [Lentinula raphanica]|uniref:Uncharacterized protein n=1 Tax=Lentinula raphanica TaxID=153919 RepID=A0AA38U7E0_9AGAR|nr:hypothetical protein F5878DRAFT_396216 [Lentinula raphanica]
MNIEGWRPRGHGLPANIFLGHRRLASTISDAYRAPRISIPATSLGPALFVKTPVPLCQYRRRPPFLPFLRSSYRFRHLALVNAGILSTPLSRLDDDIHPTTSRSRLFNHNVAPRFHSELTQLNLVIFGSSTFRLVISDYNTGPGTSFCARSSFPTPTLDIPGLYTHRATLVRLQHTILDHYKCFASFSSHIRLPSPPKR